MSTRRFWMLTLAAATTGVALRFVYVLGAVRGKIGLVGDSLTYHRLGDLLAGGHGYIRPVEFFNDGVSVPTAEFPPAYPVFLAVLDLVGVDQPTGQRLAGGLLGGVTIVVIGLLGTAVAGRTVGVVAAWIAAVYPQLVVFDGSLLSEGPYALVVATVLLCVARARATVDTERLRWWAAAGAATGLAVMTRSEAILLVPLLLVPATRVPGDGRAWTRAALVASAGSIVLVGAWTVRNAIVLDHLQPLTNNSGTMLAGANCDAVYSGVQIGGWRIDCVRPTVPGMDETSSAAARRAAGLDYMQAHADEVPRVMAARVARTFGAWDVRTNLYIESLEGRQFDWLWAAWTGWAILAPLAVVGAVAQRRAERALWPLLVPFAIAVLTSVAAYGTQRFRMVAEPSTVVLAAAGIVAVVTAVVPAVATRRTDVAGGEPAPPATSGRVPGQEQAPGGSS